MCVNELMGLGDDGIGKKIGWEFVCAFFLGNLDYTLHSLLAVQRCSRLHWHGV